MSNKGALAVTNLLDEFNGLSAFISNKETINESSKGYGGLKFDVTFKSLGKTNTYEVFLNFKDFYDVTITAPGTDEKIEATDINYLEVYSLFGWIAEKNLSEEE